MVGLPSILAVSVYWLGLIPFFYCIACVLPKLTRFAFLFSSLGSLALIILSLLQFFNPVADVSYQFGLPTLGTHFRADPLSLFFCILLGCGTLGMQWFSVGYFKAEKSFVILKLFTLLQIFISSMLIIFLSDDMFTFLFAWEVMALSSYGLVMHDAKDETVRKAGYLYIVIAHIAFAFLVVAFFLLGQGHVGFDQIRGQTISVNLAAFVFIFALIGFGAKAGLLPLHIWLPEAHPAAPSPISALMSGVMLKTAIYGLLRITFDLLSIQSNWWGIVLMVFGIFTALFGVIYAAVQTDMKRLLAYSSIENMGVIFMGMGLTLLFFSYQKDTMAGLALAATLYHCLNHAFFKNLLFLGAGNVLHATGERNLGKLGGLIHRMPWVAVLVLIGSFSAAGVPPFNGFISEWLMLQAFLFFPSLPAAYLAMLIPLAAAAFVLAAALASFVMVKFYGIIFLGKPRGKTFQQAHDASYSERAGLLWFAIGCVGLGLFPSNILFYLNNVINQLLHGALSASAFSHWWIMAPVSFDRASYSPILYFIVTTVLIALTFLLIRIFFHGRARKASAWDCGYPWQTAKMQDTAEGFSQPVEQIFLPLFNVIREVPEPTDAKPSYYSKIRDRFWRWCYMPVVKAVYSISDWVGKIQCNKISVYLMYSFVTLMILILFFK